MKTYTEQLQGIVRLYRAAHQPWPAAAKQIALWAIDSGHWEPQRAALVDQCAEELSRAMREEYITDAQGRSVRANHAARVFRDGEQLTLWADIRSATRQHMEVAFQQRRQQIVGDCRQLKVDVDSFNQNRAATQPIQIVFDFRNDLAEMEAIGLC